MPIEPDAKDWTWVLLRPCAECGFAAAAFPRENVGAMIRANAAAWQPVLARNAITRRPDDKTWSPLEYACHVRDVYRIYDTRLARMLTEIDPLYANWDQDATAVEERYNSQDPAVVATELIEAATQLADRFDTVVADQWQRTGRRSDGNDFTVESFARYMIHDPIHHLHDVAGGAT